MKAEGRMTNDEWPEVSLGEVCEFKYGKSLSEEKRAGGEIAVYGSNGIVGRHNEPITDGPAIVVGRKGSLGEVHLSPKPCWPIDTTYFIDRSATKTDLRWLAYRLKGLGLTRLNKAAAVPGLNREDAYRQKLKLPPLAEQRRIAEVLDWAEALRAKRRAALAQLDPLTQSLFLDLFGDPISNPLKWPQENLETFFHFRTGKLDSNAAVTSGQYPFFTCSREDFRIDTFAFDCEALLLAGNNASADYSVKHYKGKFNAYQRTYVITLRDKRNSYDYSRFVLEHRLGELKRMSKGTGTKYLTMELLNRIRVPVPPIELQREFARRVTAVEALKTTQRASLAELDALFATLQHRAFRGEL